MEEGDGETQQHGGSMIRKANIIGAALVGLGYLCDGIIHFTVSWVYAVAGGVLLYVAVFCWRNWSLTLLAAGWGVVLGVVTVPFEVMLIAQRISVFGFFFAVLPAIFAALGLLMIFFFEDQGELKPSSSLKDGLRLASAILGAFVGVAYLSEAAFHPSSWGSGLIGLAVIGASIVAIIRKRTDFLSAAWGFLLGELNLDLYEAVSDTISNRRPPNHLSPTTCAIMFLLAFAATVAAVLTSAKRKEAHT